jgi:hypothetical protein
MASARCPILRTFMSSVNCALLLACVMSAGAAPMPPTVARTPLLLLLLVVVVVVGLPAPHRALYLAQNQLSGDFPDAISVLTNLKELGLWSNRSEGGGGFPG